jgi:hypothetical protein
MPHPKEDRIRVYEKGTLLPLFGESFRLQKDFFTGKGLLSVGYWKGYGS